MTIVEFLEMRIAEDEMRVAYYGDMALGAARVLAECAAKRRIIEALDSGRPEDEWKSVLTLEWVLAGMAAIYADHPDYDPAWRV